MQTSVAVSVPEPTVRDAVAADIDALGTIWHDGWHEAHASLMPSGLTRVRTLESFRERIRLALASVRAVGPVGSPLGFCMLRDYELNQLFVAAAARGTGAAAALMADAETRLADSGVALAWLSCAIGNERAARFYEKAGWRNAGVVPSRIETSSGDFVIDVWHFEKLLQRV